MCGQSYYYYYYQQHHHRHYYGRCESVYYGCRNSSMLLFVFGPFILTTGREHDEDRLSVADYEVCTTHSLFVGPSVYFSVCPCLLLFVLLVMGADVTRRQGWGGDSADNDAKLVQLLGMVFLMMQNSSTNGWRQYYITTLVVSYCTSNYCMLLMDVSWNGALQITHWLIDWLVVRCIDEGSAKFCVKKLVPEKIYWFDKVYLNGSFFDWIRFSSAWFKVSDIWSYEFVH